MNAISKLLRWLADAVDPERRRACEAEERRDKTVATIQAGIVATLLLWGLIAVVAFLAQWGDIIQTYRDSITAGATVAIALFTLTLWFSTERMQRVTERTLGHLDREHEAEHRPWISTTTTLVSGMKWTEQGAEFTLLFVLKNSGRTPALDVEVFPSTFALSQRRLPLDEQRKVSAQYRRLRPHPGMSGFTIFPGASAQAQISLTLNRADIKAAGDDFPMSSAFVSPVYVVGCVAYVSSENTRRYQTGFIYSLMRFDPNHPNGAFLFSEKDGDLGPDLVRLGWSPLGTGVTD